MMAESGFYRLTATSLVQFFVPFVLNIFLASILAYVSYSRSTQHNILRVSMCGSRVKPAVAAVLPFALAVQAVLQVVAAVLPFALAMQGVLQVVAPVLPFVRG